MENALTERHVQAIWYDARLRPTELRTARGARLVVVDPGEWNLESGPDFRHAVLEVGPARVRLEGDVEVHLHPNDWMAHGHAVDPAYQHVVAHVTWYDGRESTAVGESLPAGCVSIRLGEFLRTRPDFSPGDIDVTAYPYAHLPPTPRPCEARFAHNPDRALAVMRQAGRRRLAQKAGRLAARFMRTVSREQVFYEEAITALGYKYNSFPFRLVAAAVPWDILPDEPSAAEHCLACAAAMRVTAEEPWRRAHVRPGNTPERRLAAAAVLFSEGPNLLARLLACDLTTREGECAARDILCNRHCMGKGRAGAVLANVLVPFALAEGRLKEVPDWICPEDLNAPVRLTAFRLLGRDHNPALYAGNGLLLQGLLQIHREFCLAVHPDCSKCRLLCS